MRVRMLEGSVVTLRLHPERWARIPLFVGFLQRVTRRPEAPVEARVTITLVSLASLAESAR